MQSSNLPRINPEILDYVLRYKPARAARKFTAELAALTEDEIARLNSFLAANFEATKEVLNIFVAMSQFAMLMEKLSSDAGVAQLNAALAQAADVVEFATDLLVGSAKYQLEKKDIDVGQAAIARKAGLPAAEEIKEEKDGDLDKHKETTRGKIVWQQQGVAEPIIIRALYEKNLVNAVAIDANRGFLINGRKLEEFTKSKYDVLEHSDLDSQFIHFLHDVCIAPPYMLQAYEQDVLAGHFVLIAQAINYDAKIILDTGGNNCRTSNLIQKQDGTGVLLCIIDSPDIVFNGLMNYKKILCPGKIFIKVEMSADKQEVVGITADHQLPLMLYQKSLTEVEVYSIGRLVLQLENKYPEHFSKNMEDFLFWFDELAEQGQLHKFLGLLEHAEQHDFNLLFEGTFPTPIAELRKYVQDLQLAAAAEKFYQSLGVGSSILFFAGAGAALGTLFLPLPFLGTAIGALVGAALGLVAGALAGAAWGFTLGAWLGRKIFAKYARPQLGTKIFESKLATWLESQFAQKEGQYSALIAKLRVNSVEDLKNIAKFLAANNKNSESLNKAWAFLEIIDQQNFLPILVESMRDPDDLKNIISVVKESHNAKQVARTILAPDKKVQISASQYAELRGKFAYISSALSDPKTDVCSDLRLGNGNSTTLVAIPGLVIIKQTTNGLVEIKAKYNLVIAFFQGRFDQTQLDNLNCLLALAQNNSFQLEGMLQQLDSLVESGDLERILAADDFVTKLAQAQTSSRRWLRRNALELVIANLIALSQPQLEPRLGGAAVGVENHSSALVASP